ncbi:MAG: hypothetical protein WC389_14975 [Lutibacter sp.]|jgi:hypothetical protein
MSKITFASVLKEATQKEVLDTIKKQQPEFEWKILNYFESTCHKRIIYILHGKD